MLFFSVWRAALLATAAVKASATPQIVIDAQQNKPLQDIVTWDAQSLFVRGERVLFYSGEVHPYRIPVPSLWLDIFQKIKALGYNGVSFYVDWALLEAQQGDFRADGIFALEPFFDAAQQAGIYLLARPGPYINAEVAGGGFPGWLSRSGADLRTRDPRYLNATQNYVSHVSRIIAKAQITNGGPVILLQPENEYSDADPTNTNFPDPVYFKFVEDQYRNNGIVVPLISNDASPNGYFADGPPRQKAAVDIYGHDSYPLGFDCANPYTWPDGALPTNFRALHLNQSASTPYSIIEFQGGSFDPWGGSGTDKCVELLNAQFERVFYKNLFSFGITIFNIYMTYGGTNWGNIGWPGVYTSYDYGAVIAEDRTITREKYAEAKLEANFLQSSPAYLTAVPQSNNASTGAYTGNDALFTTALLGNTSFFVVRHTSYSSLDATKYNITLPTSKGKITIPQLGGSLLLNGRDSKVHVADYDLGGVNLLYSSAEIFTWKSYQHNRVLIVYGGPGELHELAISNGGKAKVIEGTGVKTATKNGATVISYSVSSTRRIVQLGSTLVYLLDRQSAYDYWVVDLPNDPVSGNYTNNTYFHSAPIVRAGYLLRSADVSGSSVHLTGDINQTVPLEVIGGAPQKLKTLTFNGESIKFTQNSLGVVKATATYKAPAISLPDLSKIGWKVLNSLPEITKGYDDSLWTSADLTYSNNTERNLTTPRSLYSSDYGYHTGNLLYRGYFKANGKESSLQLSTQGGSAYAHSVWLNSTFVGSFYGAAVYQNYNASYTLPKTTAGQTYVLTVLLDNMGLDQNYDAGGSTLEDPRGILDYALAGHSSAGDVRWKLTGNLHGEAYVDKARGPLNEGGLFAERNGYHLPGAPTASWRASALGPMQGISAAGVAFYATTFDLDLPRGYDVPLSLVFANDSAATRVPSYRCQLYVNGYQFGKYVHNIGPQGTFPVPEGIWNYHGSNYVAVSLWALEADGAKVANLSLVAGHPVQSGFGPVALSPMTGWTKRAGAY